MKTRHELGALVGLVFGVHVGLAPAQAEPGSATGPYGPAASTPIPRTVYWGDTHLHTSNSPDANLAGNARLGPEEAYRFARGEPLTGLTGREARLDRPLDFLVVADHAEYLGVIPMIRAGDERLLETTWGARLAGSFSKTGDEALAVVMSFLMGPMVPPGDPELSRREFLVPPWQAFTRIADAQNAPGVFTAFIGYEWSSTPGGDNLHRVVVYRDGADRASRMLPLSALDSEDPEELWAFLAAYESETGGKVLAIPHNGNVSGGLMFVDRRANGEPLDRGYGETRARGEPLYEVTQNFGDGEAHPLLSPDDEFADFETWDQANLIGVHNDPKGVKTVEMLRREYGREALKLGLAHERTLGVNPFKIGFVGGTDMHTAMATADESNFWGKTSLHEPSATRLETPLISSPTNPAWTTWGWQMAASGYTGVWATENTREALFDAMARREAYATTGPRMTIRFFGGWGFTDADAQQAELALVGYREGVPMGGELRGEEATVAPTFLLSALKDPIGANLDRVQVVKGWVDGAGETRERIFDVAVSDGRTIGSDGRARESVGNTVDAEDASYTNSIGAVQFAVRWQDPDFDPGSRAFYYLRVIEIPTPRWPAYDIKLLGAKPDPKYELITQERAYTSPIWYTP